MNRKQLIVLWVGILLIAGMCLYPPWTVDAPPTYFAGYAPLWRGPEREYEEVEDRIPERRWRVGTLWFGDPVVKSVHVYMERLVSQCIPVVLLTAFAIMTLRTRRRESRTSGDR